MKPERKQELEEEAKTRTEDEVRLMHVLYVHMVQAFGEVVIAETECADIEDERVKPIAELCASFRKELEEVADSIVGTIPGIMTKEEAAEEMEQERLKSWLSTAVRPEDADE